MPITTAAVVDSHGAATRIAQLQLDEPRADEILVKVVSAGVCHTDVVARNGDYPVPTPIVLGHEGAGIVEAIGSDVDDIAVGDHVVLSFVACGNCSTCLVGRPALCQSAFEQNFLAQRADGSSSLRAEDGTSVHGLFFGQSSFSTRVLAPARSAVVVDPDFDLKIAGPLGCGFQTGAGAVLNSLRPEAGSSIVVFGVGAVGLAAIMAAKIAGCSEIIAVDRHESRLNLAAELGATHTLQVGVVDVLAEIKERVPGGVGYALDTTGNPGVVRQAIDSLRVAGVFGLIGAAKFGTEVSLDLTHMLFGRIFRGIIEGDSVPREFIPRLVAYQQAGHFPIEKLIRYFSLDQLEEAIAASESGEVIKPVIAFG
ncbi:NAD(P)-dependent alcohol dehydrogenase [Microbacterium maritypicum]|uniref:NAD(P)-dependent alcohol dehydrogenase n=1 Tax=Microbacterium maritypicum TaxID=33918 RepID=UPI00382F778F